MFDMTNLKSIFTHITFTGIILLSFLLKLSHGRGWESKFSENVLEKFHFLVKFPGNLLDTPNILTQFPWKLIPGNKKILKKKIPYAP